jgi:hypothetical protein
MDLTLEFGDVESTTGRTLPVQAAPLVKLACPLR